MPDTLTPNLGLTKIEVGASDDTWGAKLNANCDAVDALFDADGVLLPAHSSVTIVPPQGRLTLTSGVGVTIADVTGAGTLYFTPYKGAAAPIWNGSVFRMETLAQLSQAASDTTKSPAAVAADKNYHLFVWNDGGTRRLSRGPAWASDTAAPSGAGTAELQVVQGVQVNRYAITNGPAAGFGTWVGTVRSTSAGLFEDSLAKRFVWNKHQRCRRPLRVLETTNSWTATNAAWGRLNSSVANQLAYVCGEAEDAAQAVTLASTTSNDTNRPANVGIGVDSASTNSALVGLTAGENNGKGVLQAHYEGVPGVGYRYLAALQRVGVNDGTTYIFYGDNGGDLGVVSGITGAVWG